jgi:hypothetical protein
MNTYHIEYIIHVDVEAENEEEALELGGEQLYESNCLADYCELLAINETDDTSYNDDNDEVEE